MSPQDEQAHAILIVDDDEPGRCAITRILARAGYRVLEAATGAAARRVAAERSPDLVIMDVHLPDGSGLESCRRLKADPAAALLPVLLLSATAVGSEAVAEGLESGADAYLTQPVDPQVLLATVSALLRAHQAERALRASEARFRSLVETTSDWIWEVDAQGVYTYASPKVRDLLGYEPEEVLGRTPFELMPPEEAARVAETVRPFFARAEAFSGLKNRNLHKEGHVVVLETSGVPVFDEQGALRGFRGIDRDITARIEAERAHAQEARLLDTTVGNIATRLAYFDRDFVFRRVNAAYAAAAELPQEALIGRNHFELYPDSPNRHVFEHVRDTGQAVVVYEKSFRPVGKPELEPTYWDWALRPVKDEFGAVEGLVLSLTEVTESVRLREQLLAAERARAELAEHLKDEIAHRVKNNLAMISGLLRMQADSQLDATVAAALREADSRVRAFAVIHDQMYLHRSEQVDLLAALQRIVELTRKVFSVGGRLEISAEGSTVVCAPQAATNVAVIANELITNGLKHGAPAPDGKLRIRARVGLDRGRLGLAVWNSGNPIPAGFDLLGQRGLGLTLVLDAARQYQGSFTLVPHDGGTLATVALPVAHLHGVTS